MKIFQNILNKKVYSLVIEGREFTTISIQLAESLEEAFLFAKKDFINKNPSLNEKMIGAKIGIFEVKEFPELFSGSNSNIRNTLIAPPKKEEKKDDSVEKNKFIKLLIDNENTEILLKNKKLFTKNEIQYIKDQISLKKRK